MNVCHLLSSLRLSSGDYLYSASGIQVNFLHTAQFVFKAIHHLFPSTFNRFFLREENHVTMQEFKNKSQLLLPPAHTSLSQFSLYFREAKVFNQLPSHVSDLSPNMFKKVIKQYIISQSRLLCCLFLHKLINSCRQRT